jgi:hypothetical protein
MFSSVIPTFMGFKENRNRTGITECLINKEFSCFLKQKGKKTKVSIYQGVKTF